MNDITRTTWHWDVIGMTGIVAVTIPKWPNFSGGWNIKVPAEWSCCYFFRCFFNPEVLWRNIIQVVSRWRKPKSVDLKYLKWGWKHRGFNMIEPALKECNCRGLGTGLLQALRMWSSIRMWRFTSFPWTFGAKMWPKTSLFRPGWGMTVWPFWITLVPTIFFKMFSSC